jgi:beta-lactamase regulating signal transducer with metallopeptidase domain
MMALVMEAALRSLLLALAVWAALGIFRVRNVQAEKAAWTLVLAAAVAMPLLVVALRSARFPAPKLVLPAMMTPRAILAEGQTPAQMAAATQDSARATALAPIPKSMTANLGTEFAPALPAAGKPAFGQPARPHAESPAISPAPLFENFGFKNFKGAWPATMNANAASGVSRATWVPLAKWAVWFYLLIAGALCVRLLVGLAVSLRMWSRAEPVSATALELAEGLRLRMSSELSTPVTIGSGVLLPAEYCEWKEEKLRIVLAHERSHVRQRDFYLQLLASLYAALLWLSPLGWWLKRKLSDLSEAIGDRSGLEEAASRTSYAQVLLEFAAAPRPTLIGVAMARPSSLARRMERLFNDSAFRQAFAGSRRTLVAALLAPAVLFAVSALVRVEAASTVALPSSLATKLAPQAQKPKPSPAIPATQIDAAQAPVESDVAIAGNGSAETLAMMSTAGRGMHAMVEAAGEETSAEFDRTLNFSGKLELHVGNGSGNIHLTRGAANQVHIHARIHSEDANEADAVHALAANPPIVQDGNVIRVGPEKHGDDSENRTNHISIDYEIEAPADTALDAASGSGNIVDQGVGQGAKLSTGSGNIEATGLEGGFKTETGSGNIAIDEAGDGDAKAETGSGNIDVKGVHGALKAETGSGDIKAAGTPSSPWKLETGSGNVEFAPGSAPLNLEASTGSGSISSDHPTAIQVSSDGHKMSGQLNGGGPEVHIETGSGDIRLHD